MTCPIAELYLAEIERHKTVIADLDAEVERRRLAGELSAEELKAWLEATYGDPLRHSVNVDN